MSYYRSDWPELGVKKPICAKDLRRSALPSETPGTWTRQRDHLGGELRWKAHQNELESNLYGISVWYLVLEANDPQDKFLDASLDEPVLDEFAGEGLEEFLSARPSGQAYVAAKVVPGEPAHKALLRFGFEEVERRRLYTCRVGELRLKDTASRRKEIEYTSLSDLPRSRISSCHEEVLELCRRSFLQAGHSRHFTDPLLLERRPGVDYVLALMDLNFRKVPPKNFLIAFDAGLAQVCGFTAVGKKPGLLENTYTQLLTAVSSEYRGQGIYHGLTTLLSRILAHDVRLLNVTHATNHEMQKAYQDSGRLHLADTVILRRVFSGVPHSGSRSHAQ